MICVDSKRCTTWCHPGTGTGTSMPKKVATARLTARRIPEKLSQVTRKLGPGLARNFEKSGPKSSRKENSEIYPKFWKLHLLWFEWLNCFRFGNLKNFGLRPLVKNKDFRVTEFRNFSPESGLIWQLIFFILGIWHIRLSSAHAPGSPENCYVSASNAEWAVSLDPSWSQLTLRKGCRKGKVSTPWQFKRTSRSLSVAHQDKSTPVSGDCVC